MLRFLRGEIASIGSDCLTLDVSGMGFEITCTRSALKGHKVGDLIKIPVFLHVSDGGLSLYGFCDELERDLFFALRRVKGVGNRLALSMLCSLPPQRLIRAISSGAIDELIAAPGVGKRMAERICFELKGGLGGFSSALSEPLTEGENAIEKSVIEALKVLGFSDREVFFALERTKGKEAISDEARLLQAALRELQDSQLVVSNGTGQETPD
jgi:Holliday junction DNA helicase RuvA